MTEINFCWSVYLTKLLILEYKKHNLLYNRKNSGYKDRRKRSKAYIDILDAVSKEQRGCTVADIKRKVNSLRSQYLREKMKARRMHECSEDIYIPKAYWYDLLSFLDSSLDYNSIIVDINADVSMAEHYINDDFIYAYDDDISNIRILMNTEEVENNNEQEVPNDTYDVNTSAQSTMEMNNEQTCNHVDKENNGDSIEIFMKFIGSELRQIRQVSGSDVLVNKAKRNIQNVLLDTWDRFQNHRTTPC